MRWYWIFVCAVLGCGVAPEASEDVGEAEEGLSIGGSWCLAGPLHLCGSVPAGENECYCDCDCAVGEVCTKVTATTHVCTRTCGTSCGCDSSDLPPCRFRHCEDGACVERAAIDGTPCGDAMVCVGGSCVDSHCPAATECQVADPQSCTLLPAAIGTPCSGDGRCDGKGYCAGCLHAP